MNEGAGTGSDKSRSGRRHAMAGASVALVIIAAYTVSSTDGSAGEGLVTAGDLRQLSGSQSSEFDLVTWRTCNACSSIPGREILRVAQRHSAKLVLASGDPSLALEGNSVVRVPASELSFLPLSPDPALWIVRGDKVTCVPLVRTTTGSLKPLVTSGESDGQE